MGVIDISEKFQDRNAFMKSKEQYEFGKFILDNLADEEQVTALYGFLFFRVYVELKIGLGLRNDLPMTDEEVEKFTFKIGTPLFDVIDSIYRRDAGL